MSGGGGGGGAQDPSYYANIEHDKLVNEANARRETEGKRQQAITDATKNVSDLFDSKFTPDFYTGRTNDYVNYYKPQLNDQFANTQKALTYWLTDRGLLDSSIRNDKQAELQKTYDQGLRTINSGGVDQANQARDSIEQSRASLINDIRNSNDPEGEGTTAQTQVASLAMPEPLTSPLANMFSDFTGALAQQAALERASAYSGGAIQPAFNTGLFAPSRRSVVVG